MSVVRNINQTVYICAISLKMKRITNGIAHFFRFFLLLLFISYYGSISFFYHAHLVNGQIICHSHPFKSEPNTKNPFQSHTHSPEEYALIHQLSKTNWENAGFASTIPEPVVNVYNLSCWVISPAITISKYSIAQLRAPPVC